MKTVEELVMRFRATSAYQAALRKGVLIRGTSCSECGSTENIHGHHDLYENPLDVVWLCLKCHRKRHRNQKLGTKNDVRGYWDNWSKAHAIWKSEVELERKSESRSSYQQ